MYANVSQVPVLAGRDDPFIFAGEYAVESAQPLFAGLTLEPAQPLFAGMDRGEVISLKGRRGFGEMGAGGTVALGAGALVLSAAISFGLMTLASYAGARLAGCRREPRR